VFGDSSKRREAARHIAVECGITGLHLALVAGGEHYAALFIRDRHEQHAADALLDVLLGGVHGQIGNRFSQSTQERLKKRLD
jgi:hypothetical protein